PFPGREGSHTTAWAVYGDAVRRGVVGRPPVEAVANLRQLTAALGDGSHLSGQRRQGFIDAVRATHDALDAAVVQGAMQPAAMQRAISQYLAARTLAPLANADFGAAQAVGGGEASARNRLRLHESGEQQSVRRLQESIWTLLDLNTIVQMQGLREHA